MRVESITVQNSPNRKKQSVKNTNYLTPIQKQTNYDLYFKSLEGISSTNKSSINSSRNIAFGSLSNTGKVLVPVKDTEAVAKSVINKSVQLLQETVLSAVAAKTETVKALGPFGSVDSIKALYQVTKPEIVAKFDALLVADEGNAAKVEQLYHEFAKENLLTLASKGDKNYTGYWAKNKKIGRKSLVNFWLEKAGIDPKGKTPAQKAEMLNGLATEAKQKLIGDTIEHWVETILPKELDKLNKKDLKHLEAAAKEHPFAKVGTEDIKDKMLSMVKNDGIEQFEAIQQGDKNLVEFWIDAIDGEGAVKNLSGTQRKRRLVEILESPEDFEKLRQQTIEGAGKTSEQIKRTQSAYQNLIEESELDQTSQELLKTYQDNQLFFQAVTGGAKNTTSTANLEASTQKLLTELAKEQSDMIQKGRAKVFEPLRDARYLLTDPNSDTSAQSKTIDLTAIIGKKIAMSTPAETKKIQGNIQSLRDAVENSYPAIEVETAFEKLSKEFLEVKKYYTNLYDGASASVRLCKMFLKGDSQSGNQEKIERDIAMIASAKKKKENAQDSLNVIQKIFDLLDKLHANFNDKENFFRTLSQIREKLPSNPGDSEPICHPLYDTIKGLRKKRSVPDIYKALPSWLPIVDTAQRHFETVEVTEALDKGLKHRRTVQKVLAQKPAVEIQQALESKTLNPVQKDLVARYADNPHLKNLLSQPAGKYGEDISNLAAVEQLNWTLFDSISQQFRTHLSLDVVKQAPKLTDIYVHTLGLDPTKLSAEQKYKFLSSVPSEELELASHAVRNHVEENFLVPAMSNAIQDKVRILDPGHNTAQMVHQLDKVNIQLANQQYTLNEISSNIDYFINTYKETSAEMIGTMKQGFNGVARDMKEGFNGVSRGMKEGFNKMATVMGDGFDDVSGNLVVIAKSLEDMHADTSSIRNNIKISLFQSIKNTKNSIYREELQGLMKYSEKQELSEFMKTVSRKQKEFRRDHPDEALYEFVKDEILPGVLRASPMMLLGLVLAG